MLLKFNAGQQLTAILDGKAILIQRMGQQVVPVDEWIYYMDPWSGDNFNTLKSGIHTISVRGSLSIRNVPAAFFPNQREPREILPIFLDAVILSTFPDEIRDLTRDYSKLLVKAAFCEDLLQQRHRFHAYKNAKEDSDVNKLLDELKEKILTIDRALTDVFEANRSIMSGSSKLLNLDEIHQMIADTQKLCVSLDEESKKILNDATNTAKRDLGTIDGLSIPALKRRYKYPVLNEILFSTSYHERSEPWQAGSPKWEVFEPLGYDLLCPLRIGRRARILNPSENIWNFREIDELTEAFKIHNYRNFQMIEPIEGGMQQWVMEKSGEEIIGRRGAYSLFYNDVVMNYLKKFITEVGFHHRDNSNLAVYAFNNEPSLELEMPQKSIPAFRQYLRKKYTSIDNLNKNYETNYTSFNEIKPPEDIFNSYEERYMTGLLYDYIQFRNKGFASIFSLLVDAMHHADPNHPVMSKFLGNYWSAPLLGLDYYRLAKVDWDMLSHHECLSGQTLEKGNYVYSINRYFDRPKGNDECHWDFADGWSFRLRGNEPALRAITNAELLRELVWGNSIINIERGIAPAWNNWDDSILKLECDNETIRYCSTPFAVVREKAKKLKHFIFDTRIIHDGIGILEPMTSLCVSFPQPEGINAFRNVNIGPTYEALTFARWLNNEHFAHLYVTEDAVIENKDDLSEFKILFAPYATQMKPELSKKLLEWVRNGGVLLCDGPPDVYDQYGHSSMGILREVFGITKVNYMSESERNSSLIYMGQLPGRTIKGQWMWKIDVPDDQHFDILAKFDSVTPAIFAGNYGRGSIIVSCISLASNNLVEYFCENLLHELVEHRIAQCSEPMVRLTTRRSDSGVYYLSAINYDPLKPYNTVINLKGRFSMGWDMYIGDGYPFPLSRGDKHNTSSFGIHLDPGEGTILILE